MAKYLLIIFLATNSIAFAQNSLGKLTVEKIMRDPKWIGTSPSNISWSADGTKLFFYWNPASAASDSLYYITKENLVPIKATTTLAQEAVMSNRISYNKERTAFTYARNGDVYFYNMKNAQTKRITQTAGNESNPLFSFNDTKIVYAMEQNLYAWDISTGAIMQLTRTTTRPAGNEKEDTGNQQEQWLKNDQLAFFEVLKERKEKRDATLLYNKDLPREKELRGINIENKSIQMLSINNDGRFVSYRLFQPSKGNKNTIVPNYITESGFTTDIPGRTKVGEVQGSSTFYVYDRITDTIFKIGTGELPGIADLPDYTKDYINSSADTKKLPSRMVDVASATWSSSGRFLLLDLRSQDNKDRWLAVWDSTTKKMRTIDRQRDEAWVGGPGSYSRGWINDQTIWYVSEKTGYSHLYVTDVVGSQSRALTSGRYEVQNVDLSLDKKHFYITTNEVHPGEKHFYRIPVTGGKAEQLTTMEGNNQVVLSPDEKMMAILYSYSNKPTELYFKETATGKIARQVTNKAQSTEFKSYQWMDPQLITFKARDGESIYARMYKPANPDPKKPAVIFVHGAGYLQNAHKWWSSYFREYMFHNLLAAEGYTVLDIDYRGSAGYGRDWRTGIYRHMGGKDLTDHVDAANFLVNNYGIDKNKIGIYGGSYGGFITLMALFTTPDVFAAGAALRPVTDWANYNHGYTSNILNEPYNDSIAYRKSSPLYYAEGLKNHLLMCHGMLDVNVHYQDVIKLSQRLIELRKDNWELASYPMEDHAFVEPSSWTDEYKRIFKLFETVLKQ